MKNSYICPYQEFTYRISKENCQQTYENNSSMNVWTNIVAFSLSFIFKSHSFKCYGKKLELPDKNDISNRYKFIIYYKKYVKFLKFYLSLISWLKLRTFYNIYFHKFISGRLMKPITLNYTCSLFVFCISILTCRHTQHCF